MCPGDLQCVPGTAGLCLFACFPDLRYVNVKLPRGLINHVLRELKPTVRLLVWLSVNSPDRLPWWAEQKMEAENVFQEAGLWVRGRSYLLCGRGGRLSPNVAQTAQSKSSPGLIPLEIWLQK